MRQVHVTLAGSVSRYDQEEPLTLQRDIHGLFVEFQGFLAERIVVALAALDGDPSVREPQDPKYVEWVVYQAVQHEADLFLQLLPGLQVTVLPDC